MRYQDYRVLPFRLGEIKAPDLEGLFHGRSCVQPFSSASCSLSRSGVMYLSRLPGGNGSPSLTPTPPPDISSGASA